MNHRQSKKRDKKNLAANAVDFADAITPDENSENVNGKVIVKVKLKLKSNYVLNFSGARFFGESAEKPNEIISKEEAQTAENKVKNQRSKKKKITSLIFFLINIAVIAGVLIYQISTDMQGNIMAFDFSKINWWYIVLVFGLFLLVMASEQFRFINLIKKATGLPRPYVSYKVSAIGKYYDMITPFAVGGQPFQIYYLNKYGISGGAATSITMGKYIFSQIVYFIIVSVVMFGALGTTISGDAPEQILIRTASWVGYGVMFLLIATVTMISLSRKIGAGLVVACLKLFCKIFRRDYSKLFGRVMRMVMTWQHTMKRYSKSPWVWIVNLVGSATAYISNWLIPFFIFCAFTGGLPADAFDVLSTMIALIILTELASSIMPLPGGTGMAELSFMALFASMFASAGMPGALFWALIIWRIATYYLYLLQGLGVLCYDFAIGNRRLDKYKDKWLKPRFKFIRKIKDD